jgi:hypothetical protein
MAPVMAAFRAIVCAVLILGIGGAQAHAERRPVAVVDLANEPATRAVGDELKAALEVHPDLRTLPSSTDDAALIDKLDDPDADRITRALAQKARAEAQIVALDWKAAIADARDGQSELLFVTPSRAIPAYADLAYVLGVAFQNDLRPAEAKIAFAHASRLNPSFVPDSNRVPPDIVDAYADAKAAQVLQGTIEVPGTGNVWIDGTEVGLAPGTFPASEGEHVVWRTGIDRETHGLRVAVAAAKTTLAPVLDKEAERRVKVQRARQLLARAPDPSARSAAIKRLAELVGVKDAVLMSMSGGKVIVQTWHDGVDDQLKGFSALRERGTATAEELLRPLAPPPKKIEKPDEGPIKIPVIEKSFLERRPVQLGLAAGIAVIIVGAILYATRDPGTFQFDRDLTNEPGTIGR